MEIVRITASMTLFTFAGRKQSFFGDLLANGEDTAKLYTDSKVVVA